MDATESRWPEPRSSTRRWPAVLAGVEEMPSLGIGLGPLHALGRLPIRQASIARKIKDT